MDTAQRLAKYFETDRQRHFESNFLKDAELYETWDEVVIGSSQPGKLKYTVTEEDVLYYNISLLESDPLLTDPKYVTRLRRVAIPKRSGSKELRVLSIPTIRDRVVQGALKLILEPILEADFQSGSYGYRPKRSAHQAVSRVSEAITQGKTRVLDFDLRSYFDNIRHDLLFEKVAYGTWDSRHSRRRELSAFASAAAGFESSGACFTDVVGVIAM